MCFTSFFCSTKLNDEECKWPACVQLTGLHCFFFLGCLCHCLPQSNTAADGMPFHAQCFSVRCGSILLCLFCAGSEVQRLFFMSRVGDGSNVHFFMDCLIQLSPLVLTAGQWKLASLYQMGAPKLYQKYGRALLLVWRFHISRVLAFTVAHVPAVRWGYSKHFRTNFALAFI